MQVASSTDNKSPTPAAVLERPPANLARRVVSGGAWSIGGRFVSMGCLFVLNAMLARHLSKGEYAAFLTAASIMPFLAMLTTLGTPFTLVRTLRDHNDAGLRRQALFRAAMFVTLIGAVTASLGVLLAAPYIPSATKWSVLSQWPLLMCCWFVLSGVCIVCASFLQGVDDFRSAALVGARSGGLIPNVLATGAVAATLVVSTLGVPQVILYQAVSCGVAIWFAGSVLARRQLPGDPAHQAASFGERSKRSDVSARNARWFFKESWPNLINQLISIALVELDLFWLTCFSDESTVAEYGVVRQLRLLITSPLLIGTVTLAPFIAELNTQGRTRSLERMLRGTATVFAAPSIAALAVLLLAPESVIALTFGPGFQPAAMALRIASIGCIIFVISGNNGLALTMTGRHRDLLICSLFSLGLYLAISPALVAKYGVTGAAAAFAMQMIVLNVIATIRVRQTMGIWTIPYCSLSAVHQELHELMRRLKPEKRHP